MLFYLSKIIFFTLTFLLRLINQGMHINRNIPRRANAVGSACRFIKRERKRCMLRAIAQ